MQSLGTMLVRGTYKQIANAVWRNVHLRKHLVFHVLKDIDKECVALCSKKNPSILRSPSKERMLNFSFEEQRKELEERAPLFFSVLVAAGSTKTKTEEKAWIPAVSMDSCCQHGFIHTVKESVTIYECHSTDVGNIFIPF